MDGWLLLDDAPGKPGDPRMVDDVLRGVGRPPRGPRIRCPRCRYRPTSFDRWICRAGCEHAWNTFDTRGRCPACGFQWLVTACPSCHEISRHVDWYAPADGAGPAA
jgi:hypothetical protein